MAGFVYILSNPAFPHLIKIGKSERDPVEFRSGELYTTGVPQQFAVEYYAMIENYHFVESECHKLLDVFRPNKSREFFEYPVPEAIALIRRISSGFKFEKVLYRTPEEISRAEEQYQSELRAIARRKQEEKEENEKAERLRQERKNIVDFERSQHIKSELSSTDFVPSLLSLVFGVLTLALVPIGFLDGELWPFLVTGVMWGFFWFVNKQREEAAEKKAREKFPYT